MADSIQILDKTFIPFIAETAIRQRVAALGKQIDTDYKNLNPLFIGILNGAFIFAADLFRAIAIPAEISFIKLTSYKDTATTGNVLTAIGLNENIVQRHILIIEDIIDTGTTLHNLLPQLQQYRPASLKIAAFLSKPTALKHPHIQADYTGFEIPNNFVLGYGLDYNGYGRNLPELYCLKG
jgi:hypoxanthine phosphoribosyltransferase